MNIKTLLFYFSLGATMTNLIINSTTKELYIVFPYEIDVNELDQMPFKQVTQQILSQQSLPHTFFCHSLKVSIGSLGSAIRLNALRLRFNDSIDPDLFNINKNFVALAKVILYKEYVPNKVVALTQEQLLDYFTTGIERCGHENDASKIGKSLETRLHDWTDESFSSERKRRNSCKGTHIILQHEDVNDCINLPL